GRRLRDHDPLARHALRGDHRRARLHVQRLHGRLRFAGGPRGEPGPRQGPLQLGGPVHRVRGRAAAHRHRRARGDPDRDGRAAGAAERHRLRHDDGGGGQRAAVLGDERRDRPFQSHPARRGASARRSGLRGGAQPQHLRLRGGPRDPGASGRARRGRRPGPRRRRAGGVSGGRPVRARRAGAALLVGALLLVALASSAEAQRPGGGGKGRHRGGAEREKSAQEALAPGEYALDGAAALEAINRGEGSEALAYYERTGEQAGRDGNQVRAARAWHAATVTALRLARFQKVIQDGGRALEMFKAAGGLTPSDLGSWASVHAQLGSAYRAVGDLPRARATLEEGVALARTRMSGRREDQAEGYLLNGLAQVAFAQRDYPSALARATQAAQFFEGVESGLPPRGQEHLRTKLRRWNATSLTMV